MAQDEPKSGAWRGWATIVGSVAARHLRARFQWLLAGFVVTIIEFTLAIIIAPEGTWAALGAAQAVIVIGIPMTIMVWKYHQAKVAAAAFVGLPRRDARRLSMRTRLDFSKSVETIRAEMTGDKTDSSDQGE